MSNITVQNVLDMTVVSNGFHDFALEGGTVRISEDRLRPALEAAFDPDFPNWVELVQLD